MRLKAPEGVGDPCVAGALIVPRDGVYEVEAEIAALLIECFGFIAADDTRPETATSVSRASGARRAKPAARKS